MNMSASADQLMARQPAADRFSRLRQEARRALMQTGFPDRKTEAWKYTPLRLLNERRFTTASGSPAQPPELPFDAWVLHFGNGILEADGLTLPEGVSLQPASPELFADQPLGGREDAFAWLNQACFAEAWHLRIDTTQALPLVVATTTSEDFSAAVHPRLFIELADQVSATVIELQSGGGDGLVNIVTTMRVGRAAALAHIMRRSGGEQLGLGQTRVELGRDANYRAHILDTGMRLGRQDLKLVLAEPGASAEIDGTVVIGSGQHVDYHTTLEHQTGHTNSREVFRVLADGNGVGVLNGRVHIHPDADDSHSNLNIGSLPLGEKARINAKPELEIYSEEVTAAHGATIGQLDEEALFYLRSRGIAAEDANTLLKLGFAAEPLERLADETLRNWLRHDLEAAL